MVRSRRAAVVVAVAIGCAAWGTRAQAQTPLLRPGRRAPDFRLENLDGRPVVLSAFRGRTVVLVIGRGRAAGILCGDWGTALRRALAAEARAIVLGIADVHLPFFLSRDFVRSRVRRTNEIAHDTMLLDWGGEVSERFGADLDDDLPHLFVVDPTGIVRANLSGPHSTAGEQAVVRYVLETLAVPVAAAATSDAAEPTP